MHVKCSSMLSGNGRRLLELAELSTARLAELARAGEREAFDPLFRRLSPRLLGWAVRRTNGDLALAEDIVSETWAAMVTAIQCWNPNGTDEAFIQFLFGVARVRGNQLTAPRWRETSTDLIDAITGETPTGVDVEPSSKPELLAQLREAIEALPPMPRQVVRMRLDGMSNHEIAQATGLTGRQASAAWKRAQDTLRRTLVGDIEATGDTNDLALMRAAAQQLQSPRARQVALMRLDGMSNRQIAHATGLTTDQATDTWREAKKIIRKFMDRPEALRRTIDPRHAAQQERKRAALRAAAQQLTPTTRQVALMHLDGMRQCEIARCLGKPRTAVKSTWHRARTAFVRDGLISDVESLPTSTDARMAVAA